MSSHVHAVPATASYRAGSLRQVLRQCLGTPARNVWKALEAHGQRRAAHAMRFGAEHDALSHPTVAEELWRLSSMTSAHTSSTKNAPQPGSQR